MLRSPDRLYYFSGSADVGPGSGANEYVSNPRDYLALSRVPHWRRTLSNFHVAPFQWGGLTWNTIEHAFQASKISLSNPTVAYTFALESGSVLSRGDGKAAQAQRKIVRLGPGELSHWDSVKGAVMASISRAKYSQCQEAREVLLLTGNAELWHGAPRVAPSRMWHLEELRP